MDQVIQYIISRYYKYSLQHYIIAHVHVYMPVAVQGDVVSTCCSTHPVVAHKDTVYL